MSGAYLETHDAARALDEAFRRLQRLEQGISLPGGPGSGGGTNEFETILLGPPGSQVQLDVLMPPPPGVAGIVVTPGSFGNRSFVDVSWPSVPNAAYYQVELAEYTEGVRYIVDQSSGIQRNVRFDNLRRLQTYSVRVASLSRLGLTGAFSAWINFNPLADQILPGVVTGLLAGRGATTVVAKWDEALDEDVKNNQGWFEVELSYLQGAVRIVVDTQRTGGTVLAFRDVIEEKVYSVRVSAIDSSGNQGPWSAYVSMEAGGIVRDMILAGEIYTDHMEANTIKGDRIEADTLSVEKLTSSTLTAKTITIGAGGNIKIGDSPGNPVNGQGMFMNTAGISFYNPQGVRSIYMDASLGSGTFTGALYSPEQYATEIYGGLISGAQIYGGFFKTDTEGMYIHIGGANNIEYINWVSSDAAETEKAHIYMFQHNPGAPNRQYLLDIKATTLGDPAGYGSAAAVRLGGSSFDNSIAAHVLILADASTYLRLDAAAGITTGTPHNYSITGDEIQFWSTDGLMMKWGSTSPGNNYWELFSPAEVTTDYVLYWDGATSRITVGPAPSGGGPGGDFTWGSPVEVVTNGPEAEGTSQDVARADHVHGYYPPGALMYHEFHFSQTGSLVIKQSVAFKMHDPRNAVYISAHLGTTATSGTYIVEVMGFLPGAAGADVIHTFSFSTAVANLETEVGYGMPAGTRLWSRVTQLGAGAKDLLVQVCTEGV